MEAPLQPVPAIDILRHIDAEIGTALRYGLIVGQPADHIDVAHISTAKTMLELLITAQKGVAQ